MWKAASSYDGSSPLDYWLKFKATGRMRDVVGKRNPYIAVEQEVIEWETGRTYMDLDYAYHQGAIAQAVEALTPLQRSYVRLRFWEDVKGAELDQHFGYEPTGIWRQARKNLRKQLEHLKEYV